MGSFPFLLNNTKNEEIQHPIPINPLKNYLFAQYYNTFLESYNKFIQQQSALTNNNLLLNQLKRPKTIEFDSPKRFCLSNIDYFYQQTIKSSENEIDDENIDVETIDNEEENESKNGDDETNKACFSGDDNKSIKTSEINSSFNKLHRKAHIEFYR